MTERIIRVVEGRTIAVDGAGIVRNLTSQAQVAASQAVPAAATAVAKAAEATTQAGIATTKAGEASSSAASALASKNAAATSATTAATQAGVAATQAGISTSQAIISSNKAALAAGSSQTALQAALDAATIRDTLPTYLQGIPGGNVMAIGSFVAQRAAMTGTPKPIPLGALRVQTAYHETTRGGAGQYLRDDTLVTEAFAAANPLWTFRAPDENGDMHGYVLDELIVAPEMFGARGDGVTNDTSAMQALSAFVTWRGGGTVVLSRNAVYRVGRQAINPTPSTTTKYYIEEQVLDFQNCRGLTIIGNGATLKNIDGLHYGSFDPLTGERYDPPPGNFSNGAYRGQLGHILNIAGSQHIAVDGLTIDGNSGNMVIGGRYSDSGIQLPGDCLRLSQSTLARLSNLKLVNSPHDGLYLLNSYTAFLRNLQSSIVVENVLMDMNGRQGCSVTGGSGYLFRQCQFNRSGQGAVQSAPMAGCDLEPASRYASNIAFDQCEFVANGGVQLIGDSGTTEYVTVDNCVIWGGFDGTQGGLGKGCGHAMWISNYNWIVRDTEIHGTFGRVGPTTFLRSTIDNAIHPTFGQSATNQGALLNVGNNAILRDCKVEVIVGEQLNGLAPNGLKEASRCQFIFGGPAGYTGGAMTLNGGVYTDCQFIGSRTDFASPRPQFGFGNRLPTFRGVNTVSGNARVNNFYDSTIPNSSGAIESKRLYQQNNISDQRRVRSQEYGIAAPTAGYWEQGSIVWNAAHTAGSPLGWLCTAPGGITTTPWAPDSYFDVDDVALNDSGKTYVVTRAGVSASTGGPTGTGATIIDGTITWKYVGPFAFAAFYPAGQSIPGVTTGGGSNVTLANTSKNTLRWNAPFSGDRNVTINPASMMEGRRFRIVRTAVATGTGFINIIDQASGVTLKSLAAGQWAEAEYDGAGWFISAAGTGV